MKEYKILYNSPIAGDFTNSNKLEDQINHYSLCPGFEVHGGITVYRGAMYILISIDK